MLTIVDFLPNTVYFQSFELLTEQTYDVRLENLYEHFLKTYGEPWKPLETFETHTLLKNTKS